MRKCFVKSDVDRCSMMSSEKLMQLSHRNNCKNIWNVLSKFLILH